MIIVSQDKETIVNFDKVTSIYVIEDYDSKKEDIEKYNIDYSTDEDINFVIGQYKTKERAKEVLQEIIKSYRQYRTAECDGYTNVLEETAVFEMPEE